MSKDTVHHQVRQTLMNELGLTRESVRGIMEDIIEATVAKHINSLQSNGFISDIVRREIERMAKCNGSTFRHESIHSLIKSEAKNQIEEFVKNKIRIEA